MDKFKVVFHLDEVEKTGLALQNIKNVVIDLGEENLEIEMVANSEAVKSLVKGTEFEPLLRELVDSRVKFCACANAMRNLEIPKEDLLDVVTVVSAGVAEVIKKQAAGWAYVRP